MTAAALALAGTLLCLPGVYLLLRRARLVDTPNHRSSHAVAVVRGGGLACVAGLAFAWTTHPAPSRAAAVVLVAAMALSALGLADDVGQLPAMLRLGLQLAAGAAAGAALAGATGAAVGAAVMAVTVNTVNFMDGVNGITGVSMAVWGGSLWWAGATLGASDVGMLGALTLGCAVGFLPANLPVARMFLGDTGSYLFGGLVGGTSLLALNQGVPPGLVMAPLMVYLTDVGVTLGRRALRGDPLLQAHRDHVYQQIARLPGVSHTAVAVLVGSLSLLIVVLWATLPPAVALTSSVALLALYVTAPTVAGDRLRRTVA